MLKLNRLGKFTLMYLFFYDIYKCICAGNEEGSGSGTDTDNKQPETPEDPFKTTFDGDLINLDVNCRHGYDGKFNCTIEHTKVTYQSNCFFKKVSDDEVKIWEATGKNAFRVTLQFFDKLPFTAFVELDRGNDDTASYYLRKYGTKEWEKSDKDAHNKIVEDFLEALKKHKETLQKQTQDAIDLCLTLKNDGYSFEVCAYKSEFDYTKFASNKFYLSGGTEQAISDKHQIDEKQYTVNDKIKEASNKGGNDQGAGTSTENNNTSGGFDISKYGISNPQKHLVFEMKDKYRIVKLRYNKGALIPTLDIWQTGESYFVVKVEAFGDSDKYTLFVLDIVDKDTGKRKKEVYQYKKNGALTKDEFECKEEKHLPIFDFKY